MPELSDLSKYVGFVHTENLIHNSDQQTSYSVKAIVTGLEAVLACSEVNPAAVLGVGVGVGVVVPGIVENVPDGLVHGQTYSWESAPLGRLLRSGTSPALYIDDCAKTMGQADLWFGAGRGARSVVVCLIDSGVGGPAESTSWARSRYLIDSCLDGSDCLQLSYIIK